MNDTNTDDPDLTAAAERLAAAIAATSTTGAQLVQEHREDFDEILSTLLLDRLGEWFVAAHRSTGPDGAAEVDRAVTAVAELFATGDDTMQTVVATGFLEAMPHPDEDGREIVDLLPPPLREELRAMENADPRR